MTVEAAVRVVEMRMTCELGGMWGAAFWRTGIS